MIKKEENTKPRIDPFEPQVSPWRKDLSAKIVYGWLNFCAGLGRRWLWVMNGFSFFFLVVGVAVPLAQMAGWQGLAQPFFQFCGLVCVQNPAHSFYIGGHQMAICERCLAIYVALGLLGLLYHLVRYQLRPIKFWQYGLLALPMAIDGFTQLFGWRESNWQLRLLTGAIFGLGSVWYMFPQIEVWMLRLKSWVKRELAQVASQA